MEEKMFMTLAGYLEYLQKTGIGFGRQRFKKYWFMFDENSCSLNYYVDRETMNTLEPIGKIDMTNVTVSPTGEAGHTNEFEINCGDKKTHRFKVADWKEASDWIRKLEQKREGWCKSAVKRQTNKQQQLRATKTFNPYMSKNSVKRTASLNAAHLCEAGNSGAGLIEQENQDDEVLMSKSSSAVKEIFMGTLQQERGGLLFRSMSSNGANTERPKSFEIVQADTVNSEEEENDAPPNPPQRGQSLFSRAMSDPNIIEHANDSYESSFELIPDSCFLESSPSEQVNYKRRMWMLEEKCLTAEKDITIQTRKNIDLKKQLKKSQTEVKELRKEVAELQKLKELSNLPEAQLRSKVTELQDLVSSYDEQKTLLLDDLKMRMNQHQEYENAIQQERRKYILLEQELFKFKAKYVKLLGNAIKINPAFAEQIYVDPEEEEAKRNLLELLRNEAGDNFPFYGKTFEDQYGDLHDWATGNEVQHFLCNNLYLHFTAPEKEKHEKAWGDFMKMAKRNYAEAFEKSDRELRSLLRYGIPFDLRSKIWTILVNKQIGRIRDLKDQSAQPNGYYQSLVAKSHKSDDIKQIIVDLDRTLPQNKHFRKEYNVQGLSHMKNILLAYSIHNPNLGYCQGMNMLVAVGLLFLDEETTFWLLVLIIEKMTPRDYYTPGLLGAQADQALMRELVAEKIPQLNSHLQVCGVDIAMITFNWLLAAFVDALPTESMLRIWDCFLYEGRKVLYRFALAILKLYEKKILQMSDTNYILSYLKRLPKHIFNVDDLFDVAFTAFEPFPSRQALTRRHEAHIQKAEATYKEEEKLRAALQLEAQKKEFKDKKPLIKSRTLSSTLLSETVTAARKPPIWECGCVITDDEIWLGCGERQGAKVCVINCEEEKLKLDVPLEEFSSRLCCMKSVRKDMVVFGTLDFTIHAVNSVIKKEVWNIKVKDSVLDVVGSNDDFNLFAGLADGTVAIILATGFDPPPPCPLLIRISTEPVNCMVLTSNCELWCGSGSSISIISSRDLFPDLTLDSASPHYGFQEVVALRKTMEPLKSLSGAGRRSLYKMATGTHGIWMSYRSSPLITLYHATHHVRLLEIDYTTSFNLNPSDNSICDSQVNLDQRITSILPHGDFLWIGTGGGCVCVFSIQPNCSNVATKLDNLVQKETAKDQSYFEQSVIYQHGLIGVEGTVTEDEEKQKNRYRRRKEFGRTFHTKFTSSGKGYEEDADVFKLEFVASHNLTPEHADAVRVIIPLSYNSIPYVVTCCRVRKMNEASKSVQLWYCPGSKHPQKWQYQFVDCNAIVMQASKSSGPTVKIKQRLDEDLASTGNDNVTQHNEPPIDEAS